MSVRFRQQAVARLRAGDELGNPVRLAGPRTWIALAVTAACIGAGGYWATSARLPREAGADGILVRPQGAYALQSTAAGQVSAVRVQPGQPVAPGTPVADVAIGARTTVVRAVGPGRVAAVAAEVGQFITAGGVLVTVEPIDPTGDHLVAVLYTPRASGSQIRPGAAVSLAVRSAPTASFGFLRGSVASVTATPQSTAEVATFLGDTALANRFTAAGPPLKVVVTLTRSGHTPSGLAWSAGTGPPFRIESRTPVSGTVQLAPVRPVDWMLPR